MTAKAPTSAARPPRPNTPSKATPMKLAMAVGFYQAGESFLDIWARLKVSHFELYRELRRRRIPVRSRGRQP